jgi:hypothetical protein
MRWIRLIVGAWAIFNFVNAWKNSNLSSMEYLILGAGIYFVYKALFNAGCEVKTNYSESSHETKTIDFEEIK